MSQFHASSEPRDPLSKDVAAQAALRESAIMEGGTQPGNAGCKRPRRRRTLDYTKFHDTASGG